MGLVDDEVRRLSEVVNGLESRIKSLEERALGGAPTPTTADELRMILIGPPGAG